MANQATEKSDTDVKPRHIGLILDGNRRWAKQQGIATLEGHRAGYSNLKNISKAAFNRGIGYLSAYAFSTENWNRSAEEVKYLMDLLLWVATNEAFEMHKENIRVRFVGSKERLDAKILSAIKKAEDLTVNNRGGTLALCVNYGGQQELVEAFKSMAVKGIGSEATAEDVSNHLYAPDIPPLDLIIRTSGEQRLSNFMLWRAAYAELLFIQKHWPDFNESDLDAALAEYASRQRRFGQ